MEKILVQIFTQNLFLSRKEFTLRNSEEDLERLLNSKHLLFQCESDFPTENKKIKSLLDILKDKNTFLIRKLIIRKHQDPNSGNQYYVLLGEENTFSLEKHNYLLDIYNSWDEYSYNHFLSEDNLVLERKLNDNCEQSGDLENFWSKHRFAKKYKDVDKNTKALNTLTTSKISILDSDFNNFAKKISENYLKNCALSLSIEKEKICYNFDLEKFLIKEKEKIQKIQYESIIKNFFPYKKVCFFIVHYIQYFKKEIGKNNFDRKKLNEIIDKIKVANNHLDEITSKFKSNLNWCKNHFYYSYQLPFEECIKTHDIGEQELNIFVPSTFSLPLNYLDLLKEVEAFESNYLSNTNDIDNFSNFSILFNRLDIKLTDQEKEIKEQSKKSIELLSVFTAILALIFGGVSTLTTNTTFEEKFLTFISLFIVLFSFITLIKTFISKKKNFIEVLVLFFIYIVCLILIIGVLSITIKQKLL
ncbi:MAG: hypothetical protein PHC28_02225 [Flavobacterium sp.]|nr:hypothetical protein [Flavobacterium sp.]